jgi:pyridoxal phosphate enzyme (YggS family)
VDVQQQLQVIESRIAAACERSGRNRDDVQIIAVTKYASLARTMEVLDTGLSELGESRWQDTAPKWQVIGDRAQWHFIGHLQTNKVKDVIGKFQLIHSLDRDSLAQELERKAAQLEVVVDCLVQVNVSGEQSKYGLEPAAFESFMNRLTSMPHLRVVGLMTMAPYELEPEQTRYVFQGLRQLKEKWNAQQPESPLVHLSMGMSNDFEVAIEEGATMIRLGTILVGEN